ncbi:MAG: hypothetical protein WCK05_09895 [Planctomycetota bacterium]
MPDNKTKFLPNTVAAPAGKGLRWWGRLLGTMVLPFCFGILLTAVGFVLTPLGKLCVDPDKPAPVRPAAVRPQSPKAARNTDPSGKAKEAGADQDALAQLRRIEEINQQNRQRMGLDSNQPIRPVRPDAPQPGPIQPGPIQPGPMRPGYNRPGPPQPGVPAPSWP